MPDKLVKTRIVNYSKDIAVIMLFCGLLSLPLFLRAQSAKTDSLIRLYKVLKDSANPQDKIELLNELGKSYKFSKPDSAIFYHKKALELAREHGLRSREAYALGRIGGSRYILGEYDFAMEKFLAGLKIYEEINNQRGIALGLNNIGLIQNMQDDFDNAIKNHHKSISICKDVGADTLWGINLFNLAITYNNKGNYDSALYYADKATRKYRESGNQHMVNRVKNLKGEVFLNLEDYQKALEAFSEVANTESFDNQWELSYAFSGMASAHRGLGNINESIRLGLKSLDLANEVKAKWDLERITGVLAANYADIGRWEKAYEFLDLHKKYSDSLFNEERENKINYLQLIKKEAENQHLADENKLKQQSIEQKNNLIYGIIIFLILIILIAFILYRNSHIKSKLNKELQKKNEEIARKNEALTNLNAEKDKLFRVIAHDLKNPISVMINFTDHVLSDIESLSPDEMREFMKALNKSSREGFALLENLMDWARMQTEDYTFEPEVIDITEIAQRSIEMLHHLAENKNIDFHLHPGEEIKCTGNKNMTATIFRNLIGNAIKFTPEGGEIQITARKKNGFCEISIQDNGIGIPENDLPRLFKIDEHLTTVGTNDEKGTGLGLIICRDFVKKQRGSIGVESKYGEGSRFYFTLPLAE